MKTEIQKIENQINKLNQELSKLEFKKDFGFEITDTNKIPDWVNIVLNSGSLWTFLSHANEGVSGKLVFAKNSQQLLETEPRKFSETHSWNNWNTSPKTLFVNRE